MINDKLPEVQQHLYKTDTYAVAKPLCPPAHNTVFHTCSTHDMDSMSGHKQLTQIFVLILNYDNTWKT